MYRMTEYLSRSGRIPCLITNLCKFKSYAEGQWKRGKRKGNACQVITGAWREVLVGFYNVKWRNQKYEINIHLENKLQPLPLAYRNLWIIVNQSMTALKFIYATQLTGYHHQSSLCTVLCPTRLAGAWETYQLHPVLWEFMISSAK